MKVGEPKKETLVERMRRNELVGRALGSLDNTKTKIANASHVKEAQPTISNAHEASKGSLGRVPRKPKNPPRTIRITEQRQDERGVWWAKGYTVNKRGKKTYRWYRAARLNKHKVLA